MKTKYFSTFQARQRFLDKLADWASEKGLYLVYTELNTFGYILKWRFTAQPPAND